uniref:Ig-like domain-containing protein n=1 Tax=Cyprinus carpio TaxID=7962 RepID=A0A8C1GTR5_CYPCA
MVLLFLWLISGFLQVMFTIASIQAHPGQNVTMWCPHNIHVSGYLYWFKQTDGAVPITIVYMIYTESLQEAKPNYFNNFTKDHMVMDQFSQSTSLTIKQVKISDSGFYFCGVTGYNMKFGNGTKLQVKDDEQSSVSTEDCSRGIYFKLTLLFGGIIFFTCIVPLILAIIREHRRQNEY